MSNQEFLKQYINFLQKMKKKFGHIALLDINFNILFISDLLITYFNNMTEEQILKINYVNDITMSEIVMQKKRDILTDVIVKNEPRVYITIGNNIDLIYRKLVICASPICNPSNNEVIAIELSGVITNQNILLSDKEKLIHSQHNHLKNFTNFEVSILYFKYKAKTDEQVAEILSQYHQKYISGKMINHIIRNEIYYKLKVNNLKNLKIKAKEIGIEIIKLEDILPANDIILLNNIKLI